MPRGMLLPRLVHMATLFLSLTMLLDGHIEMWQLTKKTGHLRLQVSRESKYMRQAMLQAS
jgi:hypothetical protein